MEASCILEKTKLQLSGSQIVSFVPVQQLSSGFAVEVNKLGIKDDEGH